MLVHSMTAIELKKACTVCVCVKYVVGLVHLLVQPAHL